MKIVSFTETFFFSSGSPVRKWKVYNMKVVIQNSAINSYPEFHVSLHEDLEMETGLLVTPILLVTRVILQWQNVRLKVHCWVRLNLWNWKYNVLHLPWDYICGSGNITFFNCHKTSRDHVFQGTCEFVFCSLLSTTTILSFRNWNTGDSYSLSSKSNPAVAKCKIKGTLLG